MGSRNPVVSSLRIVTASKCFAVLPVFLVFSMGPFAIGTSDMSAIRIWLFRRRLSCRILFPNIVHEADFREAIQRVTDLKFCVVTLSSFFQRVVRLVKIEVSEKLSEDSSIVLAIAVLFFRRLWEVNWFVSSYVVCFFAGSPKVPFHDLKHLHSCAKSEALIGYCYR